MTSGQQRAIRELERLSATGQDGFELVHTPIIKDERLVATIGLRLGLIESREGGLDLREREEFILFVPPGYPFDRPVLQVAHTRFAGFPHVIWAKTICLYQSSIEWNPSDGLYGYFDRLNGWLGKAAINDMDPLEGALEPPHHITDFTQHPFVIRANAPCAAGEMRNTAIAANSNIDRTEQLKFMKILRVFGIRPRSPATGRLGFNRRAICHNNNAQYNGPKGYFGDK